MSTTAELSAIAATEELCEQYRLEHGFEVSVNKHGHIVLRTGAVDGIQMPRELGNRVRKLLADNVLRTPIIENIRTDYLMFLTGPAPKGDQRPVHLQRTADEGRDGPVSAVKVRADLYRLAAIRTVAGAEITLPGADDPVRSWLCPPDGVLAEFNRVAALTIAAGSAVPARAEIRR
jgi:hypothetical protein